MKKYEKEQARTLRRNGLSLNNIADQLNVSKSSVSLWVKDIELSHEQKINLGLIRNDKCTNKLTKNYYFLREQYQNEGRKMAKSKDLDFIAGCMLYWAEGNKSRTRVTFTNSDSAMIKVFISFLKKYFSIAEQEIKIICHFYSNDNISIEEVEKYWLKQTGLPKHCFYKTSINKTYRKSNTERCQRTKYGVCKIIVNNVKIIQNIYGCIQEYSGINNPEWIDAKW